MMKVIFLFFLISILSSCSTVYETVTNPYSQNLGSYKNQEGETVYRSLEVPYKDRLIIQTVPSKMVEHSAVENKVQDSSSELNSELKFKTEEHSWLLGFVDLSLSNEHIHLGMHAGIKANEFILFRLGTSLFLSKEAYFGFDASSRLRIPINDFKPFLGLGGFVGDSKKCKSDGSNFEICDKKFAFVGYGEIGIQYQQLTLFYRNYNIDRAGIKIPDQNLVGIGWVFY